MGKSARTQRKPRPHEEAVRQLSVHYLLGPVARELRFDAVSRYTNVALLAGAYCRIEGESRVLYNDAIRLTVPQWLGVLALATLVLALGAPRRVGVNSARADQAAQLAALHWWRSLKLGELPEHFDVPTDILAWGRLPLEDIAERLQIDPSGEMLGHDWTLTRSPSTFLMLPGPALTRWQVGQQQTRDLEQIFAQAMVDNAKRALQVQHDANQPTREGANPNSTAARAKRWLIAHYPLLGSLLTQFELVEDAEVCRRMNIGIAAIHVGAGEIYINPLRALSLDSAKFVVAHEILHAGLGHSSRRQGRDPYLWNVACDFARLFQYPAAAVGPFTCSSPISSGATGAPSSSTTRSS